MAKDSNTYDETIRRAEAMVARLEQEEALTMEEYKRVSGEVAELLKQCKSLLAKMHEDMAI